MIGEYKSAKIHGQGEMLRMPSIEYSVHETGVGLITINRPGSRNALNWEAMETFADIIEQAHGEVDLRALVITGDRKAFCAGGDLYELDNYLKFEDGERLARIMGNALKGLESLPVPTFAAVEGAAIGGGAEVAVACDIRIVAQDARIGLNHVRLAIMPAWGGGQRLRRLVGYSRALEWLCMGKILTGDEAGEYGLANQVVAPGEALNTAISLAEAIANLDRDAVRTAKKILSTGMQLTWNEALDAERAALPFLWAAEAHVQASKAFVTKRVPSAQL
jgi:enoyl-CoA hydratase/carnithine racemase